MFLLQCTLTSTTDPIYSSFGIQNFTRKTKTTFGIVNKEKKYEGLNNLFAVSSTEEPTEDDLSAESDQKEEDDDKEELEPWRRTMVNFVQYERQLVRGVFLT